MGTVNNNTTNPTYQNYQKEYQTATANAEKAKTTNTGTYQGLTSDQWTAIANKDQTQLQAAGLSTQPGEGATGTDFTQQLKSFNLGSGNSGFGNIGNANTGIANVGNENTGGANLGSQNTGNFNTGNANTGSFNTGIGNTGNANTGNYNTINNINGSNNADTSTVLAAFQSSGIQANGKPISIEDQNKIANSVSQSVGQKQNPTYDDVLKGFQASGVQGISLEDQNKAAKSIAQAYGISDTGKSNNITTSQLLQTFQSTGINHTDGTSISLEDQNKVATAMQGALNGNASPTQADFLKAFQGTQIPGISLADQNKVAAAFANAYKGNTQTA